MAGRHLLANATALLAQNASNETAAGLNQTSWLTREEVEHFLGDPVVLHSMALILGVIAIGFGRRLPQLLAAVSSISLGLWVGLVIQDRQAYRQRVMGTVDLPEGTWFPVTVGLLTVVVAGAFGLFAWRAALVLLTACLVTAVALAICRLANASPEKILRVGASLLSAYRIVGAVVLVLAVLVFALLVRRFHRAMIAFSSAHLGTLLLLSGVSFFAQSAGAADLPFSLLDDLARIMAEVRGGRCHLWEEEERAGSPGLQGCDCGDQCRTEIMAWLLSSSTVLLWRGVRHRLAKRRGRKHSEEERAPLADGGDPPPEVLGARQQL
mmetsp:Transcript_64967/g.201437  ORF Transcript_64967/g.201437 Transcript_64967/m.201437 type:complete len:324 (-) Transcript_64967:147-1118(-)